MSTRVVSLMLLLIASLGVSGCDAIAGIFQAGVWVGVIVVLGIVLLIGFIMSRGKR
jgi:hypothetical protein